MNSLKNRLDSLNILDYPYYGGILQSVDKIKTQFVDKIRLELGKQKMSQADLGDLVGMSRTNVNWALRGGRGSTGLGKYIEMADILGFDVELKFKRKK